MYCFYKRDVYVHNLNEFCSTITIIYEQNSFRPTIQQLSPMRERVIELEA